MITGPILATISAAFATLKDMVSKKLASDVDGATSAFASFFFALPIYLVFLTALCLLGFETFTVLKVFWIYVGLRALSDTVAETSKMYAFTYGELSTVTSITALHPVFMLFVSPLITNDPVTPLMAVGLLLSVAGTFIISFKGAKRSANSKGILYALLSALFFSINSSLDRMSVQAASPIFSGFVMTALACLFLLPSICSKRRVEALKLNSRAFLLRGVFEAVFMCFKLTALTYMSAPELSAITRLSVIFSVVGGNVVFKEVDFSRKLLGAMLTVIGVAIVLWGHAA